MKNTEVKERQAELLTRVNRLKENKSNGKIELDYLLESGEDFLLKLDTILSKTRSC